MKQKLLFIGITMNCAGSEKSFLSFVNTLDREKYEIDLILAKKDGIFLPLIPNDINVIEMEDYGDLFLLSAKNAVSTIWNTFIKKNVLFGFTVLPYFVRLVFDKKNKADIATRMWIKLMTKMKKLEKTYDVAIAYWGDRTMFYMVDMVKADKKITWLHFDYSFPKRNNDIYLPYFKKCDAIVNVSTAVDDALKRELPELSDKCIVIENINSKALIHSMADSETGFKDDFDGIRILTIGRISDQKGYDIAIPAFAKIIKDGIKARWYILGNGDDDYIEYINGLIKEYNMENDFVFLGTTPNPYPYLKECDVYAQPSRYEGKPISVEEAKIMAKPIIVCNYLSASEQLCGGEYGKICDIESESLYSGLKEILTSADMRKKYIDALSNIDFSNENEIEKFYKLI